jgi:LAO/AO transport system kinase
MDDQFDKIRQGDMRAAAKLMRDIEDEVPYALEELKKVYPYTGQAHVIGVTGTPGAGKSTLIDALITSFRKDSKTIGVIAIDPTSPFTNGALLGDRIRMQRHSTDSNIFIRSVASRGWRGGLAKTAFGLLHVMDALNKDIIIIETVGSGQAETDIVNLADTSILILVPGMGDMIQTMKAGILEGADIFVINKADIFETGELNLRLQEMIETRRETPACWVPTIVLTEAINNRGIESLKEEILKHRHFIVSTGMLDTTRRRRIKLELLEIIQGYMKDYIASKIDETYFNKQVDNILLKKADPYSVALDMFNRSIKF